MLTQASSSEAGLRENRKTQITQRMTTVQKLDRIEIAQQCGTQDQQTQTELVYIHLMFVMIYIHRSIKTRFQRNS